MESTMQTITTTASYTVKYDTRDGRYYYCLTREDGFEGEDCGPFDSAEDAESYAEYDANRADEDNEDEDEDA